MRVKEIIVWQVRIPLKKPIQHAAHTRTETDNIVIRVTLDDGIEGYGEGVPREYVTGETIDSALALLKDSDLAAQLDDCRDYAWAIGMAERLHLAPIAGDERGCMGNGARCALELALLDAFGKHFREPVSGVTHRIAPDLFEPHSHVRYSGAITSAKGWKARVAAWKMWVYRFTQLKIKVGIEGQNDVDRVGAIRRRVGKGMDLRIDANEAWTLDNVRAKILELKPFDITSVNNPFPHEHVAALRGPKMWACDRALTIAVPRMIDAARRRWDVRPLQHAFRNAAVSSRHSSLQFAAKRGLGYQLGVRSAKRRSCRRQAGILRRACEHSLPRRIVR